MAAKMLLVHHPEGYEAIERRVVNGGEAVTNAVARDARKDAPKKTGELVSTIHVLRVSEYRWYVTVSAPHWMTQEYGTLGRDPVILPRVKQALWWPGLPHPIARVTKHPGNKPQPFMRPALFQPRVVLYNSIGGAVAS